MLTEVPSLNFDTYTAIVLDMDNTLYDEMEYLIPAWKQLLRQFIQDEGEISADLQYIIQDFRHNGRKGLLNRLAVRLQQDEQRVVALGLEIYRNIHIENPIWMYPEWQKLPKVFPNALFFVISNGNPQQQQNKWNHLQKGAITFRETIWANEYKPKPAPDALIHLMEKYSLSKESVLFSGDDITDQEAARAAGIDFIFAEDFRIFLAVCADQ